MSEQLRRNPSGSGAKGLDHLGGESIPLLGLGAGRLCGKPSAKPGLCNSYQLECSLRPKSPHPRSLCCYSQKLPTLLVAGLADICSDCVCVFTKS